MAKFSNWSHENLAKFAQAATQKMLERPMTDALKMVQEQAEDAALWCKAATATEAHLQQALRWLHYAVEQSQADRAELLEAQAAPAPVPGMTDELREAATAAMKGLADARRDEDCELPIQLLDALEDVASTLIADLAIGAAGRAPAPTALTAAPTQEPLVLLHCGQIDSSGEQDEWDIEPDSGDRVDAFAALHPGKTIPLYPHPAPDHAALLADRYQRDTAQAAQEPAEPVAWLEEAAWGRSLHLTKPDYGQAKWRAPEPKLTPLYTRHAALQQMGGEL